MSVEKIKRTIYRCTCDLKDCGKTWESEGAEIPERCRWCGRRTWNGKDLRPRRMVTAKGKTKSVSDWARETGIGRATIRARLELGWAPEEALGLAERKKVNG